VIAFRMCLSLTHIFSQLYWMTLLKLYKYQLSLTNLLDALRHSQYGAKVDAHCDRPATKLSGQRLQWLKFLSYSE